MLPRLFTVACALAGLATAASGAFVIASGVRGGTYQRYAANLGGKLTAFRITYRNTKGSGENLELLADGRADVGFAQVDVYAGLMRSEPERFGKIGIVGRLADECIYIAYRKGNGPNQLKYLNPCHRQSPGLL